MFLANKTDRHNIAEILLQAMEHLNPNPPVIGSEAFWFSQVVYLLID